MKPDSPKLRPPTYHPVFLNLRAKKAIVIGGGKVAERKVLGLLKAGADITVISPVITKRIEKEKSDGRLRHIKRKYSKGDLDNAFIVIAATDSPAANEDISRDAPCLVNVVDIPDLCNFIVPSTVNRGPLTIAISTSGVSPALSRSIRRELEKEFAPEFAKYLEVLRKIRTNAMEEITDKKKRGRFLKSLGSESLLSILREKGVAEALRSAEDLFDKARRH